MPDTMTINAPMAHAVIKLAGIASLSDTSSTPEVGVANGRKAMKLQHQVSVSVADETASKKLSTTSVTRSPLPPSSEAQTTAASEEPGHEMRLCLRCTFIDTFENKDDQMVLSPRAASDPGSEISSGYWSLFSKERAYVAGLSQQVSETLSSKAKSKSNKINTSSGNSAVCGRFASVSASSEDGSVNRGLSFTHDAVPKMRTRPRSPLARSLASASTVASVAAQRDLPSSKRVQSSNSSDLSVLEMKPLDDQHESLKMSPDELRTLVHKNTAAINKTLNCQRLSTALTSIKEIPDQVEEVFHQSASFLMDEVLNEVSNARDLLVNSHANQGKSEEPTSNAERAAQSITMIPDMIMASFEAKFAAAMSTVRIRVDDVIQEIQNIEGFHLAKEQVVQQMLALPAEVREITRDAVKAASQESRENVLSQLERVLQSMADESMPDALVQAKRQIVARVPKKLPDTERAATEAAESNVCQAVKWWDRSGHVDNRVLADTLLRAKAVDADQSGLESLRFFNPGSVGHPELCSRACLYFSMGKCSNGMDCSFCHAPHSQRATHLDKRHRDWIRAMDFSRLFHTIRPTLKAKFVALGVGPEVWENLEALDAMTDSKSEAPPPDRKRTKELRTLQMALKYLSVRSLLTLLQNAPTIEGSPEHAAIVSLLTNTRPEPALHE